MTDVELIVVQTSFDTKEEAQKMAQSLVKNKLSACVHMDHVESFYEWNGELSQSMEYRLQIKTLKSNYEELEAFIVKEHSYDLPEIISFIIDNSLKSYSQWVESELTKG